jgi:uncharacterized membrane protein SpoIIM required for sporulation
VTRDVITFLAGVFLGLIVGMVIQWVSDLPKEYRR